jgi:hypothetical protein
MVSGDINDMRFMWFVFGLPFVLRILASNVPALSLEHLKQCLQLSGRPEAAI